MLTQSAHSSAQCRQLTQDSTHSPRELVLASEACPTTGSSHTEAWQPLLCSMGYDLLGLAMGGSPLMSRSLGPSHPLASPHCTGNLLASLGFLTTLQVGRSVSLLRSVPRENGTVLRSAEPSPSPWGAVWFQWPWD